MKSFYLLFFIRRIIQENYRGFVALNKSNTIKMFNTTNRTSRFPTRDYSDTVEIHPRKFIRIIRKHYQKFILSKFIFDIFIKHLFTIKYEFLYRISLNTWVLLLVFNEILIPQDFFTETNVTCKMSIVENSKPYPKIIFYWKFHILFLYIFYDLENMEDSNNITWHNRMMHKNENVEEGHQNNLYQNTNKNDNLLVLVFYFL